MNMYAFIHMSNALSSNIIIKLDIDIAEVIFVWKRALHIFPVLKRIKQGHISYFEIANFEVTTHKICIFSLCAYI